MDRDWGRDPAVRAMRAVFGALERRQAVLLRDCRIDPLDPRLRGWRQAALERFERAWVRAGALGRRLDAEEAGRLYCACLAGALEKGGAAVPDEWRDEAWSAFVEGTG